MTAKRILVTDDNSDYRASIMDLLELEGYEVIQATNGKDALEQLRTQSPDLILCDIDMPVMTGLEVLQQTKADTSIQHIPFIIVSGNTDSDVLAQVTAYGADGHIVKPMPVDVLLALLTKFLS